MSAIDLDPRGKAVVQDLRQLNGQIESWSKSLEKARQLALSGEPVVEIPSPPPSPKATPGTETNWDEAMRLLNKLKRVDARQRKLRVRIKATEKRLEKERAKAKRRKHFIRVIENGVAAILIATAAIVLLIWVFKAPA